MLSGLFLVGIIIGYKAKPSTLIFSFIWEHNLDATHKSTYRKYSTLKIFVKIAGVTQFQRSTIVRYKQHKQYAKLSQRMNISAFF